MTALLQQAFAAAQELPEPAQDRVARWLLSELESEAAWDQSLSRNLSIMERMADSALLDHRSGATLSLDPTSL